MSGGFQNAPISQSIILAPFNHLHSDAMETAMANYIGAMNKLIQAPKEAEQVISEVVYIVYRSLLLTDDIMDASEFRGNIPTAHKVFGVASSLSASWYSMMMAAEKLAGQPKAVEVLVKSMMKIYEGQSMDILWRESFKCPTEAEYDQLTERKSLAFQVMVTDLLELFAPAPVKPKLTKLNKLLSVYYEIVDDLEDGNLPSGQSKSYCEDLNEGKFGYPLFIAINRHPQKLDQNMIQEGMSQASRRTFIEKLLTESNARALCLEKVSELEANIRMELNALGRSEISDFLLKFRF